MKHSATDLQSTIHFLAQIVSSITNVLRRWLIAGPLLVMVAALLAMRTSSDEDEDEDGGKGASLPLAAASTAHAY